MKGVAEIVVHQLKPGWAASPFTISATILWPFQHIEPYTLAISSQLCLLLDGPQVLPQHLSDWPPF